MNLCHLKISVLENKFQQYEGSVVLRGDAAKDDSGSCAVFNEQGSCAQHMTTAKLLDVCYFATARMRSQFEMEDAPKLLRLREA